MGKIWLMGIKTCNGCQYLNKKRKTNPCNIDLPAVYDAKNCIYKRPSSCKSKPKKIDPKKELQKIKDQVIDVFQTYIRYRDNFTCCCCGKQINRRNPEAKKLMHAGHFITRSCKQLLLDEKNVNAQCRDCNGQQDWKGIDPRYCSYMVKKYGPLIFDYLQEKKEQEWIEPDMEGWKELLIYWQAKLDLFLEESDDNY